MPKKSFSVDSSDFDRRFRYTVGTAIPDLVRIGLGRAAMQLLRDTSLVEPTVPHEEGFLRGSGSAFVGRKLIGTSSAGRSRYETHSSGFDFAAGSLEAVVGFNAPYAARHHEVPANFKEPGSGNKYLEAKLVMFKNQYARIVAEAVAKKAGGVL